MGIPLVLALVLYHSSHASARIGANQYYEEYPYLQQIPMYHPHLRFLPGNHFVMDTPYGTLIDGRYSVQGAHYEFVVETVAQLNHADADKLVGTMPPEAGRKAMQKYNLSLAPFSADYHSADGGLNLLYKDGPASRRYELHDFTEGDDTCANIVNSNERPLVGCWAQTDPFPEKLDSKTRYRVGGIEGLAQFASQAEASDAAEINLIDLRSDGTCKVPGKEGRWARDDAQIKLMFPGVPDIRYQIGRDLSKLFSGKTVFRR